MDRKQRVRRIPRQTIAAGVAIAVVVTRFPWRPIGHHEVRLGRDRRSLLEPGHVLPTSNCQRPLSTRRMPGTGRDLPSVGDGSTGRFYPVDRPLGRSLCALLRRGAIAATEGDPARAGGLPARLRSSLSSLKLLMLRPPGPILRSEKQVSVSKICSRFAVISQ
jgi:hypothetical protein